MRVLLVEDVEEIIDAICREMEDIEFTVVRDRDAALSELERGFFDVAVCDLHIPPSEGELADIEHGKAVLLNIRDECSGTPIIAFTAYDSKEFLRQMWNLQSRRDFLGTRSDRSLLEIKGKDELSELRDDLQELAREFAILEEIEIAVGTHPELEPKVERVLRIYARQRGCVLVRAEQVSSGHSGVPVISLTMERDDGSGGGSAVARISTVSGVDEERHAFEQYVSGVLEIGHYPEITGIIDAGVGGTGAVFYQFAGASDSFWQVPCVDDSKASEAVTQLFETFKKWTSDAVPTNISVGDVRRILIRDQPWAVAASRAGLSDDDVVRIERVMVHGRKCTSHCDLHGGNVMMGTRAVPIDFASVSSGLTVQDAVTLELSILFHPDAPSWSEYWPSTTQLENWFDLESYVVGCPFPAFIRSCRKWASEVARGDRDIPACVYAYVSSQARFDASNENRLRAIMRAVQARLS